MTPDNSTRLVEAVARAIADATCNGRNDREYEDSPYHYRDVAEAALAACRAELHAELVEQVRGEALRECLGIAQAKIQVKYGDDRERSYDIPLNADEIEAEIRALIGKGGET